jgi:predicted RNA binding protein YcfA (HicA-like mRNA interferase family)
LPRGERLTPEKAQSMLLKAGFEWIRSKGSHRIYRRGTERIVIPFHAGKTLHPKIEMQVLRAISDQGH